jgi:hypothetical protein
MGGRSDLLGAISPPWIVAGSPTGTTATHHNIYIYRVSVLQIIVYYHLQSNREVHEHNCSHLVFKLPTEDICSVRSLSIVECLCISNPVSKISSGNARTTPEIVAREKQLGAASRFHAQSPGSELKA